MTAATETKKPAVTPEIDDLSSRIKKSMEVDTTTMLGLPTTPVYNEEAERRGIAMETIGQVKTLDNDFCAATTKALGEIGIESLDKNPDANRFSGEIPMYGDDMFKVSVDRSTTGRNPRTGEPVVTFGSIRTEYTQSVGTNRGQMAKVRQGLRELADAILNKGQ